MNILVLGHSGMLGHMVVKYFNHKKCTVATVSSRWPSNDYKEAISKFASEFPAGYIVNCAGAIPQRKDEFSINYDLPVWLDKNIDGRIVYPGTDCEIDDSEYGLSKSKTTQYLLKRTNNTKIIKTSIIGPEINSRSSLFEWFLNSSGTVSGWAGHMWDGNTSLEWAKICYDIMSNWVEYGDIIIPSSKCISKFELLHIIKETFNKEIVIEEDNSTHAIDKCLYGKFVTKDIKKQLSELKEFMEKNND